ncbi:PDZ domain-containing protein [Sandaracinus amylolyticus]|uniref:PDZ domain-containing protein n=1 Tax=Sandaracinus amylolyticus TaxID=927083 RepID=UPI001F16723A|nr:PDZ domain-containing protein [Sandaracinus amylolyticus]UJR84271.1 Hypothetical protein I5071_63480 [Sandaracinus amylolyticus]
MRALGLAIVALFVLACSRPIEAELLHVGSVSPDRVQPGHRLVLRGSGFPAGRDARVTFRGVLHRPGHPARAVDLALDGEAISSDRVELPMPASSLRRLGGRGTFRGAIRVAFGAGALDRGTVIGTLEDAVIDLVPREVGDDADASVLARLGLELAPREDDAIGLVVARVARGSRADDAGLAEGDRLLSIDGLNLLAPEELVPAPGLGAMDLRVAREGEAAPFPVRVSLEGWEERVPREAIRWSQLAALIALFAMVLLGPGATWIDRLAPTSRRMPWVSVAIATGIALGLRAAFDALPSLGLDAALLAIVAGRGASLVLGASGPRERIVAAMRAMCGAIAIVVALGVATLAIGTTDPAAIEAAQGPWPWDWLALRSPTGPLAIVLVALAAACGPVLEGDRDRRRVLDDVFLAALAACAMIALAGGEAAHSAIGDVRPGLAWIGSVGYAATATLAASMLRRARDRGARLSWIGLAIATLVIAAIAIIGALGWMEMEVPREIERAIAEVLVVGAVVIALRLATARPAEPARPANALL